ncbi:hypothetical protein L7F22_002972 [Adiantum nelumboides]|nr:hypothetical protein [Adiantum nelumboides]
MNNEFTKAHEQGVDLWSKVAIQLASLHPDCDKDAKAAGRDGVEFTTPTRTNYRATVAIDASASPHTIFEGTEKICVDSGGKGDSHSHAGHEKMAASRQRKVGKIEDSLSEMANSSKVMLQEMKEDSLERKAEKKEKMQLFGQLVSTLGGMLDVIGILKRIMRPFICCLQSPPKRDNMCQCLISMCLVSKPVVALICIRSRVLQCFETFADDDMADDFENALVQATLTIHEGATRGTLARKEQIGRRKHDRRACWAYPRPHLFMEKSLLATYSDNMFKSRLRISKSMFLVLVGRLGPHLQKQDTRFRKAIAVEKRVVVALHRLASGSNLQVVADLYGISVAADRK